MEGNRGELLIWLQLMVDNSSGILYTNDVWRGLLGEDYRLWDDHHR